MDDDQGLAGARPASSAGPRCPWATKPSEPTWTCAGMHALLLHRHHLLRRGPGTQRML